MESGIKVHVVLKVKKRAKILEGGLARCVLSAVRMVCDSQGIGVEEGNCASDHMHLLLTVPVWLAPINVIRSIMISTEMQVWYQYEDVVRKEFGGLRMLWSESYYIASAQFGDTGALEAYIRNQ